MFDRQLVSPLRWLFINYQLEFDNPKRERILGTRLRATDEAVINMWVDYVARERIPVGSVGLIVLGCLVSTAKSRVRESKVVVRHSTRLPRGFATSSVIQPNA